MVIFTMVKKRYRITNQTHPRKRRREQANRCWTGKENLRKKVPVLLLMGEIR